MGEQDDTFITAKVGWMENGLGEKCGVWLQRAHETHRRIINFEDQKVREALIELGWTPPEETPLAQTDNRR